MTGKKNRKRLSRYDLEKMKKCRAEAIKRRIEAKSVKEPKPEPSSPPPEPTTVEVVIPEPIEKATDPPAPKDPAKSEKMKAIWEARMKKRAAQAQRNLAAVRKRISKPDSSATSSQ